MHLTLDKGDQVRVRRMGDTEWCGGIVLLSSPGGHSIALELDGAVRATGGIIMGVLPLMIDYRCEKATGLTGDEYEIEFRGFSLWENVR